MIEKALKHYHFDNPTMELIRHNENMTYKITDMNKSYVMRVHKPIEGINIELLHFNKSKMDLIDDEIKLLQFLAKAENIHTQKVILNIFEKPITMLEDNIPITVLEWIDGTTLEDIDIDKKIANELGVMIGRLHNSLAQTKFENRYCYDDVLLSKMIDEASIAVTQGHFNDFNAKVIIETLTYIRNYLFNESNRFSFVHADLGKSNLIYYNDMITPIDFSLSGYCIPEMDLASAYSHINNKALNEVIFNGYKSVCIYEPEDKRIKVCFCLQILLFIIIQHNKFAIEEWFQEKLDDWCNEYFVPLIK